VLTIVNEVPGESVTAPVEIKIYAGASGGIVIAVHLDGAAVGRIWLGTDAATGELSGVVGADAAVTLPARRRSEP
jgi:hypothetical protein